MSTWKRVIVGVDGSAESRRALEWAADEAAQRGAKLTVVSTWTTPALPADPPFGSFPWGAGTDQNRDIDKLVAEMTADTTAALPDLEIERHVEPGNAAGVLIKLSHDADLLVVGSRGHGGFAGMLLGSVSQHVVAHSACPVLVVR